MTQMHSPSALIKMLKYFEHSFPEFQCHLAVPKIVNIIGELLEELQKY